MNGAWNRLRCGLIAAACILAMTACACAAQEITADDMSYWEDALDALVYDIGSREYESIGEQLAQYYLDEEFYALGYDGTAGSLIDQGTSDFVNKVAVKPAKGENPNIIIVCAHYDTCTGTPGAKDNASGLAAMLTLARKLAARAPFDNTELRFVAFAGEEMGMIGSSFYCTSLTAEEKSRLLGAFNIDLLAVDADAENIALSCNTQGGRTADGYFAGSEESPASNVVSRAFEKALLESGCFAPEERGVAFYAPRHWGEGDHVSFHQHRLDAATICFQGNASAASPWPAEMHTPDDTIVPFDLQRTRDALDIVYAAICSLAE